MKRSVKSKKMSLVPKNQPLKWYELAIKNDGLGNGGDGKEYDIQELKEVYYLKLANSSSSENKEFLKEMNYAPSWYLDGVPDIPKNAMIPEIITTPPIIPIEAFNF